MCALALCTLLVVDMTVYHANAMTPPSEGSTMLRDAKQVYNDVHKEQLDVNSVFSAAG
jgi:hypothetical protein